jgi:hypothetical protein
MGGGYFEDVDKEMIVNCQATVRDKMNAITTTDKSLFFTGIWGILINKGFIVSKNIRFSEEYFEDRVFAFKLLLLANKINIITACCYNYVFRSNSDVSFYGGNNNAGWQLKLISDFTDLGFYSENKLFFDTYLCNFMMNNLELVYSSQLFVANYLECIDDILAFLNNHSLDFSEIAAKTYLKQAAMFGIFLENGDFSEASLNSYLYDVFKSKYGFAILSLESAIKSITAKPVCIWGAGYNGKLIAHMLCELSDVKFSITDRNTAVHGNIICGVSVRPWNELAEAVECVIICTPSFKNDVIAAVGPSYRFIDFYEYIKQTERPIT